MEINFANKRVLVTGAGQGIGRELVIRLVQHGAEVVAISRTEKHLVSLKDELKSDKLTTITCDLVDWDSARAAAEKAGPIDCLVNNAAVAIVEPFLDIKKENIDFLFDINVKSLINVSQVVIKGMVERGTGGTVVNVSSQASQAALADHAVYAGTKGAVDIITKVMALEFGPKNIRVNAVNPTVVKTAMGQVGWSKPEKAGPMLAKIPLGRFSEVSEVVDAIVYLLSDKSTMINGVTLPVDGGFLAC